MQYYHALSDVSPVPKRAIVASPFLRRVSFPNRQVSSYPRLRPKIRRNWFNVMLRAVARRIRTEDLLVKIEVPEVLGPFVIGCVSAKKKSFLSVLICFPRVVFHDLWFLGWVLLHFARVRSYSYSSLFWWLTSSVVTFVLIGEKILSHPLLHLRIRLFSKTSLLELVVC